MENSRGVDGRIDFLLEFVMKTIKQSIYVLATDGMSTAALFGHTSLHRINNHLVDIANIVDYGCTRKPLSLIIYVYYVRNTNRDILRNFTC